MLDKRCLALLNIVNGQCESSGYKIFSVDELISEMPAAFGIDELGISECVGTLAEREYISVKYQDDVEICMCPLTKGRLVFENRIDEQIEKSRAEKRYFIYSFIGSFTGGALILLIAIIILTFSGVL